MTAITYDGAAPTVGGDADTWGTELNVGALAKIKVDLDMLNAAPANTILGRNEGTAGEVERLTVAEATAMLNAVAGDSGSGGTKGLVPAPAAGDGAARKVLAADGAWQTPELKAWAVITGATGALVAGRNVGASRSGAGVYVITFSTALASANYAVFTGFESLAEDIFVNVQNGSKATTGFTLTVNTQAAAAYDPTQLYVQVLAA